MPYTAKTLQYMERAYQLKEVPAPTGIGEAGDVATGNKLVALVKLTHGIVDEVGFRFYSCVATMASAAALAELVRGKTKEEALEISREQILEELESLPDEKRSCVDLVLTAFRKALNSNGKGG